MAVTPGGPATPASASAPTARATPATRLGCGRDVDEVWDHIDQPPSAHEQGCTYCTQARADLAGLAAATREMATADRADPTLQVSDRMLADVLTIVRTEVRRGHTLPLQRRVGGRHLAAGATSGDDRATTQESGAAEDAGDPAADLTVSEQVIAAVVRAVCDENPDVEAGRVTIQATPVPSSGSPPDVESPPHDPNGPNERGGQVGPAVGRVHGWGQGELEPTEVSVNLQATVRHGVAIPGLVEGLRGVIWAAVAAQIGVTVSRIDVEIKDLTDV